MSSIMAQIWSTRLPRALQESPKRCPGGPKRPPGCPQEAPKRPPTGPKRPPRGTHDAPRDLGENADIIDLTTNVLAAFWSPGGALIKIAPRAPGREPKMTSKMAHD
eukprot:7767096-Pyramimonas_sp.AAC.1